MKDQSISNSSNSSSGSISEESYISVPYTRKNSNNSDNYIKDNKNKKKYKIIIMLVKELILFILILLSIIKYKKSLKTVEQPEKDLDIEPSFFMGLIYDCFFSALYTTIALSFIQFKICKKYQLVIIIIRYLLFFIMNTGQNLDGHGTYNTIFFLICIVLGQIVLFIIFCLKLFYKKRKTLAISFFFIFNSIFNNNLYY